MVIADVSSKQNITYCGYLPSSAVHVFIYKFCRLAQSCARGVVVSLWSLIISHPVQALALTGPYRPRPVSCSPTHPAGGLQNLKLPSKSRVGVFETRTCRQLWGLGGIKL